MDAKECCNQCPEHIKIQLKPLVAQARSQADSLLFEIVIDIVPDYLIHVSGKKIDVNSNLRHRVNYPSNSAFPSSQSDLQHWQRWCQLWESSSQRKIQRLSQFHCGTHNKPSNLERERMHCSQFVFVPWKWFQMFHKMFKLGGIEFSETAKSPKLPHILKPQTQPRHSKIWSYLQVRLRYAAWKSCERCHPCQSVRCIEKHNLSRETQVTGHLKKYKPTWFTKISVLNYNSAIQRFIILWCGHSQRSSADRLCLTLQTVQKLKPPPVNKIVLNIFAWHWH